MAMSLLLIIIIASLSIEVIVARILPDTNMIEETSGTYDYSDYHKNYQEDPMELKRAALLLDRLILEKAVDNQELNSEQNDRDVLHEKKSQIQDMKTSGLPPENNQSQVDLQRRGRANRSLYWRCYFNVVTCFKKK